MRITRLVCGHCGSVLSGLGQDKLFFCSNCGDGWSLGKKGLEAVNVECRASADSQLPLPFWMVRATVHVLKRTVRNEFTSTMLRFGSRYEEDVLSAKKAETGGQSDRRTLLFPAFPVDGLPGIGVSLSQHVNDLPQAIGPEESLPDMCGGSISPVDAEVLAKCVAVGQETEKADWLAEIEIVLSSVESSLIILPCNLEVEKVVIAETGVAFFRRSTPGWTEIVDYHSGRA
ncbi:MAG: hypothetical protein KAH54_06385 [Candidatus Sabulitectum sp.]|nr:hypothetical protein [Candidatus Sabulitectum sp.]